MAPKPGDYFVVADGHGIVPYLIEAFTGSHYYHAGLYLGDGQIIEAMADGADIHPVTNYVGCHLLWSDFDLSDDVRAQICSYARTLEGKPYNELDIIALALSAWDLTPAWVWNRLGSGKSLICSQLVTVAYRHAGIALAPKKAACRVTPADLADVVLHRPVPL